AVGWRHGVARGRADDPRPGKPRTASRVPAQSRRHFRDPLDAALVAVHDLPALAAAGSAYARVPVRHRLRRNDGDSAILCRRGDAGPAGRMGSGGRLAAVSIVEAHDVVLANVLAALDLDQEQRLRARIFQPVPVSDWNESRLVDANGVDAIAVGDT